MCFRFFVTSPRHLRSLERRCFVVPPFSHLSVDRILSLPFFVHCSPSLASPLHFSSLPPFLWLGGAANSSGLDAAAFSLWLVGAATIFGLEDASSSPVPLGPW